MELGDPVGEWLGGFGAAIAASILAANAAGVKPPDGPREGRKGQRGGDGSG